VTNSLNFSPAQNLKEIELKAQNKRSFMLYIGRGISILFCGFILNRFRISRKQKAIIESQKIEVANQ
jgi:hypothetical protein